MRILVLHRIPYHKIDYERGIDHEAHDVTYIGRREILDTLPAHLRCEKIERPGAGEVTSEVLERVAGRSFERVISLSEYELLAAARVRKALGVPGPTEEQVLRVRDKILMKSACSEAGIQVPRFLSCLEALSSRAVELKLRARRDRRRTKAWSGKTVLKPVDGASSENVVVFGSREAALDAITQERPPVPGFALDRYEIEEFIDGPIVHVDGLVDHGIIIIGLASRYLGNCLDFAKGHPLGSAQLDGELSVELLRWAQLCVTAVGIRTGAFHLEAILSPTGPVFLEIGARVGGADVVDTFELATGVHLPSAELKLILADGGGPLVTPLPANCCSARYGWFVFPGHHLGAVTNGIDGAKRFAGHPRVVRWNQLPPGSALPRQITYQAREVPVAGVLRGETTGEVLALMQEIFGSVRVHA